MKSTDANKQLTPKKPFFSLRTKLLIGFTIVFSVAFLGSYYWFYRFITQKTMERLRTDLYNTAIGTADGIDVEELLALYREGQRNAAGFSDDPRYRRQLQWFQQVHKLDPRVYPYSFLINQAQNNRHIEESQVPPDKLENVYLVDSLWLYQPDKALKFLEAHRSGYESLRAFQEGITVTRDLYTDQWGSWMSAYTPLRDRKGTVVGVLGVDIEADYVLDVQAEIRDRVGIAFAITYVLILGLVYILAQIFTKPLNQLKQAAQQIGEGAYDQDFSFLTQQPIRDEINDLAHVFEIVIANIQGREKFLKAIVEDQTEFICRFLPDGTLVFINNTYCNYLDRSRELLIGENFLALLPFDASTKFRLELDDLTLNQSVKTIECCIHADRQEWQQWTIRALFDANDHLSEFQAVGRDISDRLRVENERKKAEAMLHQMNIELDQRVQERTLALQHSNEQLTIFLEEKELLLKEVHHRVKNNLQVISSIFSLQAHYNQTPEILAVLTEGKNRVRSMALIHEKLYQSDSLARIHLDDYVRSLAAHLFSSYKVSPSQINLELQICDITLNLDTAIPCGLIINELISNCLKYAFPEGRSGRIQIYLSESENHYLDLIIQDDGVGLPIDFDIQNTNSLGFRLVRALTQKLRGTLTLKNKGGAFFQIIFPHG